jgi:hypothetical protein
MRLTKIHVKNFNPVLLREELQAGGILNQLTSVNWVGFHHLTDDRHRVEPNATRQEYARTTAGGVVTIHEADPGEIHFEATADPGQPLDDVLTSHDATGISQTEAEENTRGARIQEMRAMYLAGGPSTDVEARAAIRAIMEFLWLKFRE